MWNDRNYILKIAGKKPAYVFMIIGSETITTQEPGLATIFTDKKECLHTAKLLCDYNNIEIVPIF